MKFIVGWFVLFLVVTLVFGWAEVGICYLFARFVADNMVVFLPLLGVSMTINLMLSCRWMVDEAEKEKAEKSRIRKKRSSRNDGS